MLFLCTLSEESTGKQTSDKWNYYKDIEIRNDGKHYVITLTSKILTVKRKSA